MRIKRFVKDILSCELLFGDIIIIIDRSHYSVHFNADTIVYDDLYGPISIEATKEKRFHSFVRFSSRIRVEKKTILCSFSSFLLVNLYQLGFLQTC